MNDRNETYRWNVLCILPPMIVVALALMVSSAFAQQGTANGRVTTAAPTYSNNATAPVSIDTAGNLRVNCLVGCASGSSSNASDAVATSSTNGQSLGWSYLFNGTTWDRQRGDATNGAWVNLKAMIALPAGSAIVGKFGIDQTTPGTTNGVQVNAALPAGANLIGKTGIDQTTPGTTNAVALSTLGATAVATSNGASSAGSLRVNIANDNSAIANFGMGATGSAVPANAQLAGARSAANMVPLIQADSSAAYGFATASTTQLVALNGSMKIYVTSFDVIANGTTSVDFVYGTGTNCATGLTGLTGQYPLTAQAGIAKGSGLGPVLVVPSGNALCVRNSAAIQISGSVSYTQF